MPIEGSLRELAMPDIFQLLHLSRKTGELSVEREASGERGTVLFHNGAVVAGQVNGRDRNLGQLLLTAGKVTEAELRRAEEARRVRPDRSWRDVFKDLGVVTAEEIDKYMRFQVEETVFDLLGWDHGRFSFSESEIPDSRCLTWIPTESLLMEAARRADERSALPAGIESTSAVPRLSDSAAEGGILDLEPADWEVLGRVDGEADVRSIAWDLGRSELEVSKAVSRLVQQGLVTLASAEDSATKPPHEVSLDEAAGLMDRGELDAAQDHIESVLRQFPSEPRAHYLAGRLAERLGRLREALQRYEKTLAVDPLAEEARLRLGLVRLRLGDLPGTTREWTAYLRMAPDGTSRRRVERAMSAAHELLTVLEEFDGE